MVRMTSGRGCTSRTGTGARGGGILREPADYPYGERQYTVEDPRRAPLDVLQTIADVAPEEWGGTTA